VTFFSERLEPNIYIFQALGRAVLKNMEDDSRFFVLAEKTNQKRIYKKSTLSQRAVSFFFTTEDVEVKRAGENE